MKRDAAAVSPFAALNPQEQKEQWIWWQCQQGATYPPEENDITPLLQPSEAENPQKPTEVQSGRAFDRAKPTVSRYQYNAVVNRMQQARRRAGAYTDVSG